MEKTPMDAPPPYGNAPGYPPASNPQYQPQSAPVYQQSAPGYQPQSAPGYPPQSAPGYQPNAGGPGYTTAGYQPVGGGYQGGQGYNYPQTTATVTVAQPGQAVMARPQNYAAMAWLSCLFCFWPLGIAAIVKSNEVDTAANMGDYNRSMQASRSARLYSLISIGIGVGSYIVGVILIIMVVVINANNARSYYNNNY